MFFASRKLIILIHIIYLLSIVYSSESNGYKDTYAWAMTGFEVNCPKNSRLVTKGLEMAADKMYKLSFQYRTFAAGCTEFMEVCVGKSADTASLKTQIWDNKLINTSEWKSGYCYVNPSESAKLYLVWHAYSY